MGKNQDGMSEAAIVAALEGAKARVLRAERERDELQRVITSSKEERRLLESLLALRRGSAGATVLRTDEESTAVEIGKAPGHEKHPSVEAVVEELTTAGRPLHISELMRLLQNKGVPISGAGTQANLITHIRRDARVVRPSRGMYGLASSGLEGMSAPRRSRRRRKRIRSTASK